MVENTSRERDDPLASVPYNTQNKNSSTIFSHPKTYKVLVENLEDHAIFMMDTDGIIQTWNVGAEQQLGYSHTEVLGKHFSLIFTEEDIDLHVPQGELTIAEKEGRCRDDRKHVRKDGAELWVNGVVTTIKNEQGDPSRNQVFKGFRLVKIAKLIELIELVKLVKG